VVFEWILPGNTGKVDVHIAVVHYIKPITRVNHGVDLMAFLKIASSGLVFAADGKDADVGVFLHRFFLWGDGFIMVASFYWS